MMVTLMRNWYLVMFGPCVDEEPVTYEEAVEKEVWKKAMDNEIEAMERNNTWELTLLPKNAKRI